MIDARTQAVLQNLLRRETLSLLQYVGEAFPWAAPGEEAALDRLRKLVAEDRESTAALGRFLTRLRRMPPYLGTYPTSYTSLGFVSLDFLLPRLAEEQRGSVAELERDLAVITDPEARAELERMLAMKRRHLATLEELTAARRPEPAVR
jgi:hypothetical protein